MNIVDKILVDPSTRGLKFFTKGGVVVSLSPAGILPIGAVVATFPNLTGAYACATTTAADAYGYVKCNGQTLSDGTSTMNGAVIPNINNSIFLMGSTTAGSTGGDSSVTLSTANVPSHTHSISGTAAGQTYSGTTSTSSISGTTGVTDAQHYHQFALGTGTTGFAGGGSGYSYNSGSQNTDLSGAGALNHSHSISGTAAGQTYSGTTSTSSISGTTGTGSGSGTSFSIVPTYISAVFVMRVK